MVRSSATQEELKVQLLLQEPAEVVGASGQDASLRACPSGRRPQGRPMTHLRDYISQLAWEGLGLLPEELVEVAGGTSVF